MFATRWGDHRVTGKALLFSLMLHFGCLVGVVTVVPAPSLPPGDPEGGEQSHRVMIRSVAAQAERDFGADVGGRRPDARVGSHRHARSCQTARSAARAARRGCRAER